MRLFFSMSKTHNIILEWLIDKTVKWVVTITFFPRIFSVVVRLLSLIVLVFNRYLRGYYKADSAIFLAVNCLKVTDKKFARKFLFNKLLSRYLKLFMYIKSWKKIEDFLDHTCVVTKVVQQQGKLLLCTHTGDYWLIILNIAREYEGQNCDIIIPVYEKINEQNARMYNKINISGVNVIFMHIHEKGALLKLSRYLKRPDCIVAIFYDLSCYISGVYNGAVEPVNFCDRKGYMTTGIAKIAARVPLQINFVSCRYVEADSKFFINISRTQYFPGDQSMTSTMITFLESYLAKTPWQWHFISNLDSYFHVPFSFKQAAWARETNHFNRLNDKYANKNV